MTDLQTAIENLYTIFSGYSTNGMLYCNCGCITQEEVRKLHSKPLRQLDEEDVAYYHGSALYTWGELDHYKHFLPRFLELYSEKKEGAIIGLSEIGYKLEYAGWKDWADAEVKSIREFLFADWNDFVNISGAEIRDNDLENYSRFLDIEQLLEMWNINQSANALRNFVLFFYYHGNQILNNGFKINDKHAETNLKKLIYTRHLSTSLQDEFFKYESIDAIYAEKVSVVLQMIEQQFKLDAQHPYE